MLDLIAIIFYTVIVLVGTLALISIIIEDVD